MDLADLAGSLPSPAGPWVFRPMPPATRACRACSWHRTSRLRATAKTRADVGQSTTDLLVDEKGVLRWQPGPAAGMSGASRAVPRAARV